MADLKNKLKAALEGAQSAAAKLRAAAKPEALLHAYMPSAGAAGWAWGRAERAAADAAQGGEKDAFASLYSSIPEPGGIMKEAVVVGLSYWYAISSGSKIAAGVALGLTGVGGYKLGIGVPLMRGKEST